MERDPRSLAFAWRSLCARPYGTLSAPLHTAALKKLVANRAAVVRDEELYYATRPPCALSAEYLRAALPGIDVRVALQLDSTQDEARRVLQQPASAPLLVTCEAQSAGRGRGGKTWVSPFGRNLYFTLALTLERSLPALGPISLAVGASLVGYLRAEGIHAEVKWPNDIWVAGRKLAGVLVEAGANGAGQTQVLIGVGCNLDLPIDLAPDQAWIDWSSLRAGSIDRNAVLAGLVQAVDTGIRQYLKLGLSAHAATLARADALLGQRIQLEDGRTGVAMGIDVEGALGVQIEHQIVRVVSGGVHCESARARPWRLLLDAGNTRLKWAWNSAQQPGSCQVGPALPWQDQTPEQTLAKLRDEITRMRLPHSPESVLLCSSLSPAREMALLDALRGQFNVPVRQICTPEQCAIWRNAYPAPQRLGVDRFLAMQSALALAKPGETILLALVGSALTIDLLRADGQHLGGLIAPGTSVAMYGLATLSSRLTSHSTRASGLANNTEDAVSAAAWQSQAGLLELVARRESATRILLSGGGAGRVAALMQQPVSVLPDLVLHGVAKLLQSDGELARCTLEHGLAPTTE